MQCPKCEGTLEPKTYGRKITIHRCTECKGLWCKPETLILMQKEWMADAVLDSGDPSVGKEYNKVDEINCPECGEQMDKSSDARQTHIWFETCPQGHGIFLDAGEFKGHR